MLNPQRPIYVNDQPFFGSLSVEENLKVPHERPGPWLWCSRNQS